jgi:hypothetical protein
MISIHSVPFSVNFSISQFACRGIMEASTSGTTSGEANMQVVTKINVTVATVNPDEAEIVLAGMNHAFKDPHDMINQVDVREWEVDTVSVDGKTLNAVLTAEVSVNSSKRDVIDTAIGAMDFNCFDSKGKIVKTALKEYAVPTLEGDYSYDESPGM